MNRSSLNLILTVVVIAGSTFVNRAGADDWPQWLGPKRDGVWRENGVVETFPPDGPPLRWKVDVGGGYASPAIADGRVFLMDRQSDVGLDEGTIIKDPNQQKFVKRLLPGTERVLCLDESDGTELWRYEYDCPYTQAALYAIGPRCTPTVDGDRVYTLGAEGRLLCLRVDGGSIVWSRDFQKDYDADVPMWGFACHPLVDGDRLICIAGGEGAVCVAFDKYTGRELWRSMTARQGPGYCAPIIYDELGGLRQLVVWHGDSVNGLNPEDGHVYWSVPFQTLNTIPIGIPQKDGNRLFLMGHFQESALIEIADSGQAAKIVWSGNSRRGIGGVMDTAVLDNGYIYACGWGGRYICARLDTGEQLWSTYEPSTGTRPAFWANVFTIRHQDRFFLANDFGDLIIAKLSPVGYEEIDRAHLIDPTHVVGNRTVVWSHPSFANQSVFLRNDRELRCYSLRDGVQ